MQKTCAYCQDPFETHRQKYCKVECSKNGKNARRRAGAVICKEKRICPYCRARPIFEDKYACQFCIERNSEAKTKKREENKEQGLCRDCNNPVIDGNLYCPICSIKNTKIASIS